MSIKSITTDELRNMHGQEGLVLQGCGGDLDEWVKGINDLLTEEKILLEGSRIEDCLTFEHDGIRCLYFPLEAAKLDMGKLTLWRLVMYENFNCVWFSDYVDNRLGGFIPESTEPDAQKSKPDCSLSGANGNIFKMMEMASKTLQKNGLEEQAKEMCDKIRGSGEYYKTLMIISEYVNVTFTSKNEDQDMDKDEEMDEELKLR